MNNEDVDVYRLLSQSSGKIFSQKPELFFPKVTELHYSEGFIDRYFLKPSNDKHASIIEVTQIEFLSFEQNPFYKRAYVRWKITGNLDTTISNGITNEVGVLEHNDKQLRNAEKFIEGISNSLSDLLQFYKAD
tara:strand:- start:157 stop:555 length:399 start_codon:yes stop_codon:yes gene_type:complete